MKQKWLKLSAVSLSFALLSTFAHAKNFGVFGETYPVVEVSFIESIQKKMQEYVDNGKWDAYKKEFTEKTMNAFKRPKGVALPHVVTSVTRFVDPSIVLQVDIQLPDGNYLARKGDRINPLKQLPMSRPLAVIDGDDEKQVAWAIQKRKENPRTTILLVNGNWYELSKKNKTKFWFDQTGEFINRMDIQRTPTFVQQDGMRLRLDETAL